MEVKELVLEKIRTLYLRPDFQANPFSAILKRLIWRIRWRVNNRPWLISWNNDKKIFLVNSGSCALIYYLGTSEPETRSFLMKFLRRDMVFIDIGAHIGEFSMFASQLIGPNGNVHAFEPNPGLYPILVKNCQLNDQKNIACNMAAIADIDGKGKLAIGKDASISSIINPSTKVSNSFDVILQTIDSYSKNLQKIDLIKVDVEGAEWLVFNGAKRLLDLPPDSAPNWLFEYIPENYSNFGVNLNMVWSFLKSFGYRIYKLVFNKHEFALLEVDQNISSLGSCNLVASKTPGIFGYPPHP